MIYCMSLYTIHTHAFMQMIYFVVETLTMKHPDQKTVKNEFTNNLRLALFV